VAVFFDARGGGRNRLMAVAISSNGGACRVLALRFEYLRVGVTSMLEPIRKLFRSDNSSLLLRVLSSGNRRDLWIGTWVSSPSLECH
jgi:hypothetical protein